MTKETLLQSAGFLDASLPNRGIELRIHRLEDYPFLYPMVFSPNTANHQEDFQAYLIHLVQDYVKAWLKDRPDDLEKSLHSLLDFQSSIAWEKAFLQIANGKDNPADIIFPVSNARLRIKRFGDCLGMTVLANNRRNDETHVDGTKILQGFCQNPNDRIVEFLHSIECIIPLPKKFGENTSVTIDLNRVYSQIEKACPYFSLGHREFFIDAIIQSYQTSEDQHVGSYHNKVAVVICAKLIHYHETTEHSSLQWKRGNIESNQPYMGDFLDGRDLCLSLKVVGSLPQFTFLKDIDTELDVATQQEDLILAGATMYSQLSAMLANGVFYHPNI